MLAVWLLHILVIVSDIWSSFRSYCDWTNRDHVFCPASVHLCHSWIFRRRWNQRIMGPRRPGLLLFTSLLHLQTNQACWPGRQVEGNKRTFLPLKTEQMFLIDFLFPSAPQILGQLDEYKQSGWNPSLQSQYEIWGLQWSLTFPHIIMFYFLNMCQIFRHFVLPKVRNVKFMFVRKFYLWG